jgi:predicted dehydrogenase
VAIGSWNCQHREHAVAALQAGKHVFCEKPLATSVDDCLAMRSAWQKSGKLFYIGFTLRYSPHYRTIHQILESDTIGSIISMEFNETLAFNHGGYIHGDWRRLEQNAGTHMLEKCCHDIDLAIWMIGSLPLRVASFGGLDFFIPENERHIARLKTKDDRIPYRHFLSVTGPDPFIAEKDIVDNQVAIMEFANGIRATFHTNCNAGLPERRMYILGTEGAIRADVIKGTIEVCRIGFDEEIQLINTGVKGGHGGGDKVLTVHWDSGMTENTSPDAGLEDGLFSAVACFGIDESLRSGQVISLAPIWSQLNVRPARCNGDYTALA